MQVKQVQLAQNVHANYDSTVLDIRVVQSTTTSAGASVWALRNSAAATTNRVLYVKKIWMQLFFNGTGAATEMQYEWIKGVSCTAMSGGSAVTGLKKKTSLTNPDIDARVLDTGITQTGISQGAAFFNMAWCRLTHSATQAGGISQMQTIDFGEYPLELLANEVLSLRQAANSVAGDCVSGGVEVYGGYFS